MISQPMSRLDYFYLPLMQQATEALLKFRDERDWKQFHDPKNLAAALSIEAAELNEVFLWKTTQDSKEVNVERVKEELADVLAYALLLAKEFELERRSGNQFYRNNNRYLQFP